MTVCADQLQLHVCSKSPHQNCGQAAVAQGMATGQVAQHASHLLTQTKVGGAVIPGAFAALRIKDTDLEPGLFVEMLL